MNIVRSVGPRLAVAVPLLLAVVGCNKVAKLEAPSPEVVFYRTGGTKPSGIQALDAKGKPVEAKKVKWSSDNEKVATVSETGEITPVAAGDAKITGRAGDAQASVLVRVVPLARIVVVPETVNLVGPGGTTALLEAQPKDVKGVTVDAKVRWMSSNPAVADVDASGTVVSKSSGVTTVVVAIDNIKTEVPVRVDIRDLAKISVHPATAILRPAEKQVFVATAFDSKERAIPNVPVSWTSTDPTVCTVDPSGLVEGIKIGTCKIKASFAGQSAESSVIINAR